MQSSGIGIHFDGVASRLDNLFTYFLLVAVSLVASISAGRFVCVRACVFLKATVRPCCLSLIILFRVHVFTALHVMQTRSSDEHSVRLSVARVDCDKTVERSVQIYGPRWSEIADFQPIFARSSSAVTPSEKSSTNANRKSTTRFPMSLR